MIRFLTIAIVLFLTSNVLGQNWQIRGVQHINFFPTGADNRLEGIEFSGFYNYQLNEKTTIVGGLTWNTNSWANHILLKVGAEFELARKNSWSVSTQLEVGNGIALFSPSPLYTFDMQGILFANYHTEKDNQWGIGLGLQNIVTPEYSTYGVFSTANLPISIRYQF